MGKRFRDSGIPHNGMLVADGAKIELPQDANQLGRLIEESGAELVILDSLRRLAPGVREDRSDDMAPIMRDIANLARKHDVAIVLIHHKSSKPNAATVRGSSAIEDQADLVFSLERAAGDPDKTRRRLRAEKFRIDESPPDLWMRFGRTFSTDGGTIELTAAEPHAGGDSDDGQSMVDMLMGKIRALPSRTWTRRELAAAVGRPANDYSFTAAINSLVTSREWVREGKTRSCRYWPADSSDSSVSLGDSANSSNGDGEG
jgi:replicative DNA helicase